MDRKWNLSAVGAAPAAADNASDGFPSNGNPSTGVPATRAGAYWYHMVTEELLALITSAGIVVDKAVLTQVRDAIRRLAGTQATAIAAGITNLIPDQAGLLKIDASAGNVTLNLPAANLLSALAYQFVRVDASANTVTVNRAGTDTIDGGTAFPLSPNDYRAIKSDGVSRWLSHSLTDHGKSLAGTGYFRLPGGLVVQWGQGSASQSGVAGFVNTFPLAFPTAVRAVQALHEGTDVTVNIITESKSATQFAARSNFATASVTINYIAIGH